MERWVAIILGLLIIVLGFVVVQQVLDGQNNLVDAGTSFECSLQQGVCTDSPCNDPIADVDCGEGRVCCPPERA